MVPGSADSLVLVRRALSLVVACILIASCGDGGASVTTEPAPPTPSTTVAAPSTTAVTAPEFEGFDLEDLSADASLVLRARDEVEVYADPGEPEPFLTLEPTTIIGSVTVLSVLEGPVDGWARVMLPIRPNGSDGWVEVGEMMLYVIYGNLVVDLSERSLTYYEQGEEVLSTTVAIGTPHNPTPTGSFFVTDNVTLADPNGPWGPHALGLSARSDTITEFNGGDGIIGIHGTNRPSSIGEAASLGCVRAPNEVIAELHELVPLGTPVQINA